MESTETKKVLSFVILNGFVCPVTEPIDRDTREEWDD